MYRIRQPLLKIFIRILAKTTQPIELMRFGICFSRLHIFLWILVFSLNEAK